MNELTPADIERLFDELAESERRLSDAMRVVVQSQLDLAELDAQLAALVDNGRRHD